MAASMIRLTAISTQVSVRPLLKLFMLVRSVRIGYDAPIL